MISRRQLLFSPVQIHGSAEARPRSGEVGGQGRSLLPPTLDQGRTDGEGCTGDRQTIEVSSVPAPSRDSIGRLRFIHGAQVAWIKPSTCDHLSEQ